MHQPSHLCTLYSLSLSSISLTLSTLSFSLHFFFFLSIITNQHRRYSIHGDIDDNIMFTSVDGEILHCPPRPISSMTVDQQQRWKSQVEIAPNCPRCASSNTKFCYYNNYSLSQPRYFCKGCRRYWTKGGSLRNVPIGGGCRKNRRSKSVRFRPDHRVFMGYDNNSSSRTDLTSTDDPIQNSDSQPTPDIDLAVVFSKFLNPGFVAPPPGRPEPELSCDEFDNDISFDKSSNSTNPNQDSSSPIQFQQEIYGFECDSDPTRETQIIGGPSQQLFVNEIDWNDHYHHHHHQPDRFMNDGLVTGYGLEPLPSNNEVGQDVLWSDASGVTDFTSWQLPSQLHVGFEVPAFDDHFTLHPNLLNWE